MGRYPRTVRKARVKCIDCNAPVVRTVDGEFACVDCGSSPIRPSISRDATASAGATADADGTATAGESPASRTVTDGSG